MSNTTGKSPASSDSKPQPSSQPAKTPEPPQYQRPQRTTVRDGFTVDKIQKR